MAWSPCPPLPAPALGVLCAQAWPRPWLPAPGMGVGVRQADGAAQDGSPPPWASLRPEIPRGGAPNLELAPGVKWGEVGGEGRGGGWRACRPLQVAGPCTPRPGGDGPEAPRGWRREREEGGGRREERGRGGREREPAFPVRQRQKAPYKAWGSGSRDSRPPGNSAGTSFPGHPAAAEGGLGPRCPVTWTHHCPQPGQDTPCRTGELSPAG